MISHFIQQLFSDFVNVARTFFHSWCYKIIQVLLSQVGMRLSRTRSEVLLATLENMQGSTERLCLSAFLQNHRLSIIRVLLYELLNVLE